MTGLDECSAVVDNNLFANLMADTRPRRQHAARRAYRLDRRHLAGAGLWLCRDARLWWPHCLPAEWRRLRFALAIRGRRLRVEAGHEVTTYSLAESDELTIFHDGEPIRLTAATRTVSRATPPAPPSAWL